MRFDRITAEKSYGKGWARITFKEHTEAQNLSSLAIVRPGHADPYLGSNGWQISEVRMPLNIQPINESEFYFFLPPNVVHYMDVSSNYEFVFFDPDVSRIQAVIVRWSGISYRAGNGELSPIQVVEPKNTTHENSTINPNELLFQQPHLDSENNSTDWNADENIENTSEIFSTTDDISATGVYLIPESVELTQPPQVRRINCQNSSCNSEILSTMKICPLCLTQQ